MMPSRGVARLWNIQGDVLAQMPLNDSREAFRGMRFFNGGRHLVLAGNDESQVNFYKTWTTDLDALYDELSWLPRRDLDSLIH